MPSPTSRSTSDPRAVRSKRTPPLVAGWPGRVVAIGVAFLLVHGARPTAGLAQSGATAAKPSRGHKPWFQGVTLERRKAARERFLEGNRLLQIPAFARAAEQYRQAIALWKHPAFYYNLVIAQLNLVQPVEAYANVQEALRYGPEPLGEDKYQQALDYKQRLEEQLTWIVIHCDEPGAEVTLDGKLVFVGPGRHEQALLPGSHQVLARKDGLIPRTEEVVLSAGERAEVRLSPGTPTRLGTERYMSGWIPWASLGAGAALLLTAGYLDWHSSAGITDFDADFNTRCRRGCTENEVPDLAARLSRAEAEKRAALGLYIAGGALVVGSAILVYANRERVVRTRAVRTRLERDPGITWIPIASPDRVGVAAELRF